MSRQDCSVAIALQDLAHGYANRHLTAPWRLAAWTLHKLHAACSPSHTCKRCEQEEGAPGGGALIACARCPISYHLECMPEAVLASRKTRVWLASSGIQQLLAPEN